MFKSILVIGLLVGLIGCAAETSLPPSPASSISVLSVTLIPPSLVPVTYTPTPAPVVSKTPVASLLATSTIVVKSLSSSTVVQPKATGTISLEMRATEQANSMFALVKDLQSRGYLSTTDGTYHRLDDHESNVIKEYERKQDVIDGFYPTNFVLQAEIAWSKPSAKALDKETSGCGFAFHKNPKSDYEFKIQLDGKADMRHLEYVDQFSFKTFLIQEVPFRAFVNQGKEKVMLVVNGNQVVLFVNDREVIKGNDEKLTKKPSNEGVISFSMENGGLVGEFTCNWSDIELWEINANPTDKNDKIPSITSTPTPELNAEDYYNLGVSLYQMGNFEEAIIKFTRSIELAPDVYVSYYARGILYFTRGDYPNALTNLNNAIELNQTLGILYYRRGQVYQRAGDSDKANADFDKAKQLGYTE
ncbi:MAG: tetratricopeptide repeat protein [Chloroflexota bacterium]